MGRTSLEIAFRKGARLRLLMLLVRRRTYLTSLSYIFRALPRL